MSNKNNICLVDFRLTGHHPFYLATFLHYFQPFASNLCVFSADTERCRESIENALPSLDLCDIEFVHSGVVNSNFKRTWGARSYFKLRELERDVEQYESKVGYEFDFTFFAYLDDICNEDLIFPYLVQLPFRKKFSGLLMSPQDKLLYKRKFPLNYLTTTFLKQVDANFDHIGILTEDVKQEVERKLSKHVRVYPDFCSLSVHAHSDRDLVSNIQSRSSGRLVTSLLGSIQAHKSVDLFLRCIEVADSEKYFFVIAGKFNRNSFADKDWEVLSTAIENPPENLLVYDKWIENEAIFNSIIQYSDLLFAFYRNFRKSSNIVTKGAYFRVPLIVSDQYLVAQRVKNYKLGYAVSEEILVEMYRDSEIGKFDYDESARQKFIEIHSAGILSDIFSELVHSID